VDGGYLRQAELERSKLPAGERTAVYNAVRKLEALGPDLPFPHSSGVAGSDGLRELRPGAGRSPWRPLYARVSDTFVIAALAPEAESDPRGFKRACQQATERLEDLGED
jgi:hypothetical protein